MNPSNYLTSLFGLTGKVAVMLSTATDNRQAQALYEGHGYQRDNEFYSYIKPL